MNEMTTWALLAALIPSASPAAADDRLPVIEHDSCGIYAAGADIEIRARIRDDSELFGPKVLFRSDANPEWRHVVLVGETGSPYAAGGAIYVAHIPAAAVEGVVEYLIETLDEHGNGPARVGSPDAPIPLDPVPEAGPCVQVPVANAPAAVPKTTPTVVTEPPPVAPRSKCSRLASKPLYCHSWFWITAGTVVAGAAAVAVLAVTRDPKEVTAPDRGVVDLSFELPGASPP